MEPIMDSGISAQLSGVQERYRFLAKLGSGGMADVFLGIQHGAEDFKRLVVIKRVHSAWLKKENALKMFINEARTVASLNHPHIVKIYDLSRMGNDICISMEYVDGENLEYIRKTSLMRNQPVPLPIVCKCMVEACEALHYAHSVRTPEGKKLNLVHRDIGPHNLMIDGNGYMKVIDFGIAKTTAQTELTSPGIIKGKFSYLAPDLFKHVNIDGRVDLYALGLVLYELVTLKRPFPFKKDVAVAEVLRRISKEELPPVSSLMPDLPKELDTIVQKATNKDRDQRYQSGAAFANDLREFAESLGGIASTQRVESWFNENYRERIARRREFERRAMLKASQPPAFNVEEEREEEPPIVTNQTINISDISQFKARSGSGSDIKVDYSTHQRHWLVPALIVSILLVLATGGVTFLYKHYYTEAPPLISEPQPFDTPEENIVADNLFVRTTPPGADIFVSGDKIGNTGSVGLNLRVDPGHEHAVVLKLEGHQDYSVKVPGEEHGQRRIDVQLESIVATAQVDTAEIDQEKPPDPIQPEPQETEPEREADKPTTLAAAEKNPPRNQRSTKNRSSSRSRRHTKRKSDVRSPSTVNAASRSRHEAQSGKRAERQSDKPKDTASGKTKSSQSAAAFLGLNKNQLAKNKTTRNQAPTTGNNPKTTGSKKSEQPIPSEMATGIKAPALKMAKLHKFPPEVKEPVHQSTKDLMKRYINGKKPRYPDRALRRKREADVVVRIEIGKTGKVENFKFINDDRFFHDSVVNAIESWRFKPFKISGKSVETYTIYKFTFKITSSTGYSSRKLYN